MLKVRFHEVKFHQVQTMSDTVSAELTALTLSRVSYLLCWHVLSEGQVQYQRGHTNLQCVECGVC